MWFKNAMMTWRALSTCPYRAAGVDVAKVVTFGAPKLGPKETREAAEGLNILRVIQKAGA